MLHQLTNLPTELAIAYLSAIELLCGQLLDVRLVDDRRGALCQEVSPNGFPGVLTQT